MVWSGTKCEKLNTLSTHQVGCGHWTVALATELNAAMLS